MTFHCPLFISIPHVSGMVISLIRMYLEYSEDKNEEVVKMCFIVVGVFFCDDVLGELVYV